MRIGFDAKRAFLNNTGLGNYSRDTIRILSKYYTENDYFLYTPRLKGNNRLDFFKKSTNTYIKTPNILGKIFHAYWRTKGIVKNLLKDKIDIYHGLSHEIPLGLEKTKIKTIVTIHDLIFIRYPELFSKIDKKIYYQKFKSSCQRADLIIAVSKQTKQDIINFFKIESDKIKVVYQGCNTIFHSTVEKEDVKKKYKLPEKFLLSVGTIEERKNLLTILKTLREIPNQELVIVGSGKKYKNRCIEFIKKYSLNNRVHLLSDLNMKEIAAIYQLAEIMIYPSLFEGFGIPILEALTSKTPVITSKNGCFSEAGGPDSIYINPLSVAEMKKAILLIQNNQEFTSNMIKKGHLYAQDFTDNKIAKELMTSYQSL
ncbi:MAG: glycosyltransferase family 1 protein [Bacteroidota bacterium]|nr:glycosyltransferase family 1 protein [Bacteroidota bacterium]